MLWRYMLFTFDRDHLSTYAMNAPQDTSKNPVQQPVSATEFFKAKLKRLLMEKSPLWLYVAAIMGIFINIVGIAFLISPNNRPFLINPSVEQLQEMGLTATQIADRLAYAEKLTPLVLNTAVGIFVASIVALVFVLRLRKIGVYAYTLLTLALIILTMTRGFFTPALMLVPTAIVVTASLNKEFLR